MRVRSWGLITKRDGTGRPTITGEIEAGEGFTSVIRVLLGCGAEVYYARKHTIPWVGDNVQITETCDDDLPHLITKIAITPGPTTDGAALPIFTPHCSSGVYCLRRISRHQLAGRRTPGREF